MNDFNKKKLKRNFKLAIVQPQINAPSETFFKDQANRLPFNTSVIYYEPGYPCINGIPILSQKILARAARKIFGHVFKKGDRWEYELAFIKIFKNVDAVLAQYGTTAVLIHSAILKTKKPLLVYFHGFDASSHDIINRFSTKYLEIFQTARFLFVVSKEMKKRLIELGAPANKIVLNPCGVDLNKFTGATPSKNPPTFIAVGRFVEKKAPHLTIMAFKKALKTAPNARLKMIGDGPLLGACVALVEALGIKASVEFLGCVPHSNVMSMLQKARAFLQHSIVASNGDSEGTPVSILEASASGLPIIATYHGGIKEAVVHERTGFLVREKDIQTMSYYISKLAKDPMLAERLGSQGRLHIKENYSIEKNIGLLNDKITRSILEG